VSITHTNTPLEIGQIVKMNPFMVDEAIRQYSVRKFHGERKVAKVYQSCRVGLIEGSNNWKRDHLLVKGVDYT
jgi:hypothetical protein